MALSELIIRFIDRFYIRAVAAIVPRQTFRYAVCGGVTVLFSWVCYYLVYHFVVRRAFIDLGSVVVSPHIATLIVVYLPTLLCGFYLNRYVAFRHSPLTTRTQIFRYLLTMAGSGLLNYVCLKLLVEWCGFWATPSQMLNTFITMIYSYLAAKYFTFRHALNE